MTEQRPATTRGRRALCFAVAAGVMLLGVLAIKSRLARRTAAAGSHVRRLDMRKPVRDSGLAAATPELCAALTVRALESGDAALLCSQADPEELQRLNLTPTSVSRFLRDTLWRAGPSLCTRSRREQLTVSAAVWRVGFGSPPGGDFQMPMHALPRGGWRISLSYLLIDVCGREFPLPRSKRRVAAVRRLYRQLARKHGILGIGEAGRYPANYSSLDEMAAHDEKTFGLGPQVVGPQ